MSISASLQYVGSTTITNVEGLLTISLKCSAPLNKMAAMSRYSKILKVSRKL